MIMMRTRVMSIPASSASPLSSSDVGDIVGLDVGLDVGLRSTDVYVVGEVNESSATSTAARVLDPDAWRVVSKVPEVTNSSVSDVTAEKSASSSTYEVSSSTTVVS